MFNYIIEATNALISMMILTGLVWAYMQQAYGLIGRRTMLGSVSAGLLAAAVMSYMKNATNKIDTSYWNLRIFAAALLAVILFWIVCLIGKIIGKRMAIPAGILMGAEIFLLLFYILPDVLAYPYRIYVSETTFFTSSYIIKLGGALIGIILALVAGISVYRSADRLESGLQFLFMSAGLLINQIKQCCTGLGIMLSKRIIRSNKKLFAVVKWSSNHANYYIFALMLIGLIIALILWSRSFHVQEPYSNPAQHRKIRAKWRSIRRWSAAAVICFALAVVDMTVVYGFVNKKIELSPTEDCAKVDEEFAYVSFEQVADGHLHRFAYTSPAGIAIRFIIIQKPNSTSYGIGMDACDICGETGYYEKDGQVICNRCDVVMNINTIGFKGGCNPKIVDYEIEPGVIKVSIPSLMQYEKDFK